MEAIVLKETGDEDKLVFEQKWPLPTALEAKAAATQAEPAQGSAENVHPKPLPDDSVLVKVHYAGINYIDTYIRRGIYKAELPCVLGREASGIISRCGVDAAKKGFKAGDRVAFLSVSSYAEYVVVPAAKLVHVPEKVSMQEAASVMLQGLTAHYLADTTFHCAPGTVVLVHAAAGGTGGVLVQIAKARGARVFGTAGTAEKCATAKKLGCEECFNYTEVLDWHEKLRALTGGEGVHAVYDGVGLATWERSMKSLRRRGYLVLFGNASGVVPPIDPLLLTSNGSLYVTRPTLLHHVATREDLERRTSELFAMMTEKKVVLRVASVLPLAKAADAHRLIASRKAAGKILLKVIKD